MKYKSRSFITFLSARICFYIILKFPIFLYSVQVYIRVSLTSFARCVDPRDPNTVTRFDALAISIRVIVAKGPKTDTRKWHLPSLHILRLSAPEALLVINCTVLALALLRHHAVLADVELGAVLGVRVGRVRQDPAGRAGYVAVRTDEAVVENIALDVFAEATRVSRPDATRHLRLVDQTRWARHHLRHPVDAVDEAVARGRVLVREVAVRAGTAFARLWLFCNRPCDYCYCCYFLCGSFVRVRENGIFNIV